MLFFFFLLLCLVFVLVVWENIWVCDLDYLIFSVTPIFFSSHFSVTLSGLSYLIQVSEGSTNTKPNCCGEKDRKSLSHPAIGFI